MVSGGKAPVGCASPRSRRPPAGPRRRPGAVGSGVMETRTDAEPVGTAGEAGAEPPVTGAEQAGAAPGERRRPPASLSPSRASDFMQCPLLYRFRVIDRLPEKPSPAATRGTLVHAVLERLFDAPAAERTAPRATGLLPGEWERLLAERPELAELFSGEEGESTPGERLERWLGEAERLVERWFTLEDPTRLEAGRAGAVRRGGAGVGAAAARHHRPGRRGAHRRGAHRGLQDGQGPAPAVRRGRALPDDLLRAGGVAAEGRAAPCGCNWSTWAAARCGATTR